MKTWGEVQLFINRHSLPYSIIRFNLSLAGRLIEHATGQTVAATVKDAERILRAH